MRKLIFILIILAAAGYIAWPYYVTDQYAQAVNNGDGKKIVALTDIKELRESLKEGMRPCIIESFPVAVRNNPAQTSLALVAAEKYLDIVLTADAIEKGAKAAEKKYASDPYRFISRGWRSPLEFVVQDNEDELKSVFRFTGFDGWKVVRAEGDKESFRKAFKQHNQPQTQR